MVFNNLENALSDENISSYLELFEDVQEPTRDILSYALDIASYFNSIGLKKEYGFFGGYAVLSHLMKEYGIDVAKIWRGSDDLDMIGTQKVLNALRGGYTVVSDLASPNIECKRTLKLVKGESPKCKIDFSFLNSCRKYGEIEENTHLGIPFRVLHPRDIVKGKIFPPLGEQQHLGDLLGMISVLEKRGYSPRKISGFFIGEERNEFYERLKYAQKFFSNDRLGFFPSKDFSSKLMAGLSKKKIY